MHADQMLQQQEQTQKLHADQMLQQQEQMQLLEKRLLQMQRLLEQNGQPQALRVLPRLSPRTAALPPIRQ